MSSTITPAPEKVEISLEDIRHKALKIRNDVADEVQVQIVDRRNQVMVGAVVGVLVVVGLAYYLGTRAAARAASTTTGPA